MNTLENTKKTDGRRSGYRNRPLTEEEREFASRKEKHDCIYKYCHINYLDVEEWYDRLIFGYLNTVKLYVTEKPELQKYAFSTILFNKLRTPVSDYYRAIHREKGMPEGGLCSLDFVIENDHGRERQRLSAVAISQHWKEGEWTENNQLNPMTPTERRYATENYYLIKKFLKLSKLDAEEFFDVVVFEYLLSVEIYLNNEALRNRCNFEAVSYMYMKRAVYRYFREQKAQKRSSEAGADLSFEEVDACISDSIGSIENSLEYKETIQQIEGILTVEQQRIFFDKLQGYSLKEIAENNGIKPKRVYRQFGKIKSVVAAVMDLQQLYG